MNRKIALVIMLVLFTAGLAFASGQQGAGSSQRAAPQVAVNKTGLPIVAETLNLEAVAAKDRNVDDWNGLLFNETYEKWTNIHVNWTMIPQESFVERRNILIASNDLPDFFIRSALSAIDESTYGMQGTLIPLNKYIDEYAPNLLAIMQENAVVRKSIASADGNIYSLPQLNTGMGNLVTKYWIRDTWLQKLNLKKPETIDEFYNTLVQFKAQDVAGTGNTIPLAGAYKGASGTYMSKFFAGAYGFGRIGGTYNNFVDADASEQMQFVPFSPNYRALLEFLNKLYSEGLIDPEYFTLDNNRFIAKCEEGNMGIVLGGNNYQWLGGKYMREYSSITPIKGPNGSQYWQLVSSFVQSRGNAAITSKNTYPEATMRYLDYLYSEEGTKLVRLGVEGVTYNKTPEGKFAYIPAIANDPQGRTQDQMVGKYTIFGGGGVPQMITEAIDLSAGVWPETMASTVNYYPYLPREIVSLNFTADEVNELNSFRNDIMTYLEEMEIKFITGVESFANWSAYTSNLERMNAKRYTELYNTAYQRYRAN